MKKTNYPSFLAKRKKLNNEIMSRRYDLYWQVNISQISADKRFWLIIFTKPRLGREQLASKDEWDIRFWIWDSHDGRIVGENILQYPTDRRIFNPIYPSLAEHYIDEKYQRLVLRPRSDKGYFIFSFPDGKLLHHTEGCWKGSDDSRPYHSCFVDKDLFMCLRDGQQRLFILSQLVPLKVSLDFLHGIVKPDNSSQFFYEKNGLDDMQYFIFSGISLSDPSYATIISIYERLDRGVPNEIYLAVKSMLLVPIKSGMDHFEVNKHENLLTISIFPKKENEKVVITTYTDLL